jgi:predicted aspartyl protease
MTQVSKQINLRILLPVVLACVAIASFAADQSSPDLKSLYDGHHWFQLRDAISKSDPSPLYQGAVAAAFDRRDEAEKYLEPAINIAPASQEATEARNILISIQMRAGHYTQAAGRMKEQIAARPGKPSSDDDRAMSDAFAKLPDMTVTYHDSSTQHYKMSGDSLSIPIAVNGRRADFILDSDSDISVISVSEAARLGMPVMTGKVRLGGEAEVRENDAGIVVAKNLAIGNIEFRNVAFVVVPDNQEPFVDLPAGQKGILGLPVMLGLKTLRWRRGSEIEIGFAAAAKDLSRANLCFDEGDPVALAEFQQREIEFLLDTGADESELWPPFAKEFSEVMSQSSKKESKTVSGFTGSKDVDVITLPEVQIKFAGFDASLRPATVLTKVAAGSGNRYFGRAGMDIFNQAQTVTIDFGAMMFTMK